MRWSLASIVLVPRGRWGTPPTREERRAVFRWARDAGYQGIELSPRWLDFHAMTEAELDLLGEDVASAGLVPSGLCISRCILTRSPDAQEHLLRLERGIEVASRLEAPILRFSLSMPTLPGPDRPALRGSSVPEWEYARSAELVKRLAEEAHRHGVGLCVELHDDGLLDTPEACLEFLDRVGNPALGVNPDLGNFCRGPGPLPDWEAALRILAPRATCWHVKNYLRGEPSPVWSGDIDYRNAFDMMRAAGFGGWVSIEGYFGDVRELQERSLRFLRGLDSD